jgi:hypothetical protein
MEAEPFALFDCGLVRCASGRVCSNLRELLEAVRTVPEAVLEHHMMRCALDDAFELNEFPNDLARWSWSALGDHALGEALSLTDPYRYPNIAELRSALVNLIEDRLWNLDRVPWCRPGLELYLVYSRLVTCDTGERIPTPAALAETMKRVSLKSLFYHVHEARRRTGGRSDDFSQWLEDYGASPSLVAGIRAIDFHFLNLSQLRHELIRVLAQSMYVPALAAGNEP